MEWSEICEGINTHKRGCVVKDLGRKENGMLPLVQANKKFNLAFLSGVSDFQRKDEATQKRGWSSHGSPTRFCSCLATPATHCFVLPNIASHCRTSRSVTWI